jgi:CheY-like chemotaxis protein
MGEVSGADGERLAGDERFPSDGPIHCRCEPMNVLNANRPILIAEDQADDVLLLKTALKRAAVLHPIQVVTDGQEVIDYVTGKGRFLDRTTFPFPEAIFLDIKMPRMDGLEVLKWIKAHPSCSVIPTIMFSSSQAEQDVHRAYLYVANAYLVKPPSLDELVRYMQVTFGFWSICVKPTPPESCG